jgi:hypothetical protein
LQDKKIYISKYLVTKIAFVFALAQKQARKARSGYNILIGCLYKGQRLSILLL